VLTHPATTSARSPLMSAASAYRYTGIILYATTGLLNGKENHVGNWTMGPGMDYQLTPGLKCMNVVTHRSAQVKPLHAKFYWTAPPGTGTVTFRILLKQGGQGRGAFYWPQTPLQLTEGTPAIVGTSRAIVGAAGASCADVCAASNTTPYCDGRAITATSLATLLQTQVNSQVVCNSALLAACPYAGGPQVTAAGYCTYRSPNITATCPAAYLPTAANPPTHMPDVCWSRAAATSQPICVCTSNARMATVNPYQQSKSFNAQLIFEAPGVYSTSAASNAAPSRSVITLAVAASLAVVAASSSSMRASSARYVVFAAVAVAFVSFGALPTEAHNFVRRS
jgi:hypothetical protein